ncbi:Septal ring factor EnvC, activator of murein hydrolases AmiA and AmiB [Dethiosulfatibacter aminovorans DSM 17477]|uniref:Septal ring factor EnvC, activator of murein hydrolases AmiA and AmiB n=1 Tax=Dethiosulfatibacter aminovorans DSM 17477 TaxID=1121476 RepID=A0A1M6DMV6_9FIRM|nr:M23 family metallopeptidase [Dethiosulfatibacter aminovorans]SHI74515.1 Septal ring factor EnvC, activator of murein hydrolases AmiA and AmiB [Dethiosulfatibacter aminovorans DSM 17477]
MIRKVFILFAVVALVFAAVPAEASSISDLQNELKNTENKIDSITDKLKEVKSEKYGVEKQIEELDGQIRSLVSEEDSLNDVVTVLENNIAAKEAEIEQIKDDISSNTELLEDRLRAMYKNGAVGYLEVLFNADDVVDFMTRADMVQRVVNSDVEILENLESQQTELEIAKLELKSEQNNYYMALEDVQSKRNDVEIASRAKETYMSSLEDNIEELKREEQKLLDASSEIENKIKQKQLEMKYAGGEMAWPAPGYYRITSPYGMRPHPLYGYWSMHTGVDVGVPMRSNIVAPNSGVVTYAGWYGAYGNIVLIDHGGGISTLMAHNTSVLVTEGQSVTKGQIVSYSGTTGMSTGPHLHFEVRVNGSHTNPLDYYSGF